MIEDTSLSGAWHQTLGRILGQPGIEITPLVVTITDFHESKEFREMLNADLSGHNLDSIETVSETIFPASLYQHCKYNRQELYEKYLRNLIRIKAIDPLRNGRGTYFERLISFGEKQKVNQLDIIIDSLQEDSTVKRRSKLQASIFDPLRDHTTGVFQGFPCLQHVTFYKSENSGLVINSFYAMQYLYQRGYGNWLGLINLAKFIAAESGLTLERFNCFIGVEKLDKINKSEGNLLFSRLAETLAVGV